MSIDGARLPLSCALLLSCLVAAGLAQAAAKPPNIVVVTIDDLGGTGLACDGSDLHQSPILDRLASQGVRFTAAYAAASICTPTRAALMTGKHPARLGMTIWHEAAATGPNQSERWLPPRAEANLPLEERTLAEALHQVGYRTYHVGKWHLGDAAHYPEVHGFDVNIGGSRWGAPPTYFWPYRGTIYGQRRYVPGFVGGLPEEYLTDRLTDEAIRLLKSSSDQPWFLNLCYHSVHTPIEGKPDLVAHYRRQISADDPQVHRNADYAAMVHSVDENIGRLLEAIDAIGSADNTLVIVTSDNGGAVHETSWGVPTSNAPLRSGKGSLYEGGVRVPLIVRWPQVTPNGQRCAARVVTHDLFATIVEAAQVPDAADVEPIDGLSLVPLLRDPTRQLDRAALFWHFPHYYATTSPVSAVLRGHHKLLYYYQQDRTELYDLKRCPDESEDLATVDTETAGELRALLDDWLQEVGARLPQPRP